MHVSFSFSLCRYDPRFFLPLLCHLCSPGSYVDRHLSLVEKGALPLAMAALSSGDADMRRAGYLAIARIYQVKFKFEFGKKMIFLFCGK